MLPALIAAVSVATSTSAAAPPPAPSAAEAHAFAISLAHAGPRPAGSPAERRAHQEVAKRFRNAGLRTGFERFNVPGKGTSRDVIGIRDTPARCLVIVMAHADTVPPAPGADDNASGVGTLVALAPVLAQGQAPQCDTWLVATGSEERPYTRQPDHLGAKALVNGLRRTHRLADVRLALSLDVAGGRAAVVTCAPPGREHQGHRRCGRSVGVQLAQHLVERALGFEADTGDLGEPNPAVGDHRVIGKAAGGLELTGVGLVAAELEGCGDVAARTDARRGGCSDATTSRAPSTSPARAGTR